MRPQPDQLFMRRVAYYLNGMERLFFPARHVFEAYGSDLIDEDGRSSWGIEVWFLAHDETVIWEREDGSWVGALYNDPRFGPSEEWDELDKWTLKFPAADCRDPKEVARAIYDALEDHLKEETETGGRTR